MEHDRVSNEQGKRIRMTEKGKIRDDGGRRTEDGHRGNRNERMNGVSVMISGSGEDGGRRTGDGHRGNSKDMMNMFVQ
eukprot:6934051-Pyramimonas_sp.AAC.1